MSDTPNPKVEENVPESLIPSGNLPPAKFRDMPEPVPLRKMLGPSIMLSGLALGSGEFILWPYITYQSGFIFFWACILGVITQYFINMEITRWSLATGESAVTGFARLSKHWAWIFLFLNIVPWMLPAWATGAAKIVGWLIWGQELSSGQETTLAIAGLFGCGLILTAGKVVYETVEKIQIVLVSSVILLVVGLAFFLVRWDAVSAQIVGVGSLGNVPDMDTLTPTLLLGALAFAGAGGTVNLGQSNYVKDKGYGMGRYIGRITSPLTGQEEAISETGYHFPHTPANLDRWRRWWRAATIEHFLTFFLTCLVCLVLLTLIAYCLFYDAAGVLKPEAGQYGKGMEFIRGQAVEINNLFGGMTHTIFLIMGIVILLTTEFGVLDITSRISMDIVKVNWLRKSSRWTESRLYYVFLWSTILLGTIILLVGVDRVSAFDLFKYSAAMNGGVMFLYCIILIYMNRFKLAPAIRMGWVRLVAMIWAVLFFGFFVFKLLWGAF